MKLTPALEFHSPRSYNKWNNIVERASRELVRILRAESSYNIKDLDNQLRQLALSLLAGDLETLELFPSQKLNGLQRVKSNKARRNNIVLTPSSNVDTCDPLKDSPHPTAA